ncbi:MAG: 4'-phosphopantetheinyl transferase superfamily protein [Eudoraea sp.]|nr:4'-phosphopantetheinyl transferase superfamily protein [Eudoraea sp.]
MPLYKKISVGPGIRAYIWQVTESEEDLSTGVVLQPNSLLRIAEMRSQLHRRAFLSIRHLLDIAGYNDGDLSYDKAGKPHLQDGNFISISHSHQYTGIIVSSGSEVGIDIEKQREKILRIAHKFTPIEEYRTIANTEALIRKLTLVWGAKESLYKIYATKGLSFLHHINIMDFSMSDSKTTGEILYKGKTSNYDISFIEFDSFSCVYAIRINDIK